MGSWLVVDSNAWHDQPSQEGDESPEWLVSAAGRNDTRLMLFPFQSEF
jgi:hypothetical protein